MSVTASRILCAAVGALCLTGAPAAAASVRTLAHIADAGLGSASGGLTPDGAGGFYGVAQIDGAQDYGGAFHFDPASRSVTKIADFPFFAHSPTDSLTLRGDALYGVSQNSGGVFKIADGQVSFLDYPQYAPQGSLTLASDGNLYGIGAFPGASAIFRIDENDAITYLPEFPTTTDLGSTSRSLVPDDDGNLWMARVGEASNGQYQIEHSMLDPTTGAIRSTDILSNTVFYNAFIGPDAGDIAILGDYIYGIAGIEYFGGPGVLYRVAKPKVLSPQIPDSLTYDERPEVLVTFNTSLGFNPYGGLVTDGVDTLYGTTRDGGACGFGTVYSYKVDVGYSLLHSFCGDDGAAPSSKLVFGQDGRLYGTTAFGGRSGRGVIFSVEVGSAAVPEPAAWATMILGFGLAGATLRRRPMVA